MPGSGMRHCGARHWPRGPRARGARAACRVGCSHACPITSAWPPALCSSQTAPLSYTRMIRPQAGCAARTRVGGHATREKRHAAAHHHGIRGALTSRRAACSGACLASNWQRAFARWLPPNPRRSTHLTDGITIRTARPGRSRRPHGTPLGCLRCPRGGGGRRSAAGACGEVRARGPGPRPPGAPAPSSVRPRTWQAP